MSIEINEDMLGIWFVEWNGGNLMAAAWRTPNGGAKGRYRLRRSISSNPENDERDWYDLQNPDGTPPTEEQMIGACSTLATSMQQQLDGTKWELLRGTSSFEQFLAQFNALPFVQFKTISAKECRFSMKEEGTNITVTVVHEPTGRKASATGSAARKNDVKAEALKKLGQLVQSHGGVAARRL